MNTETVGASRSLKSINGLISVTLVCAVLAALAALAGYFIDLSVLYIVAAALAVVAVVPCLLMFQRVKAVEADFGHREALSMAQRKETERNQQAILRLLDELAPLADGDLTVQATVTEDITGTIADSINYAIGVLRDLVSTINQSAIQLDGATRQTQALSSHLAKAASAQTKQISGATESASNMAASTEAISGNSERASDVARHSVDVA
ncbi:MAG TPA: methyl-accepting chemotaxis protein, partial [Steroidobacteraceae bacterium]|nr:methyl-accepting chemotaxis protein [Steroidobacteraceae bacterium]